MYLYKSILLVTIFPCLFTSLDCAADFLRSSGMCEACPTDSFRTIGMFEASCTCQDSRTISDGDTATTGDPCDGKGMGFTGVEIL